MKRLFGISFALIAFLLVLAVQTGYSTAMLVDQDVGMTYIMNVEKTQSPVIAPFATIGESQYSCTQELLRPASFDVNYEIKATYGICRVGNYKVYRQLRLSSTDNTTIESSGNIQANKLRGVSRLDIGETHYRQNIV